MKSPIDTVKGKIVKEYPEQNYALVAVPYDWVTASHRQYKECLVQFIDSRPLSDKQRKMCYALLREISEYTGMTTERTKEIMKIKFMADDLEQTAEQIFSLSNAPMSLVCAFQRFLIRFILEWDIPCRFPLLDYVDDIPDYIYSCLIAKKCCITGRPAELHHVDRVGMGRDRADICHEGMEVLPLTSEMHLEAHTMTDQEFFEKYHLPGGIILDKTLCKIWKLKARKDNA